MLENRTMNTVTAALADVLKDVPPHRLSIVVPMYNEVDNVEPFVTAVHQALDNYPFEWELLIVNDGSRDGTREKLDQVVVGAFGRRVCEREHRKTHSETGGGDSASSALFPKISKGDFEDQHT